MYTVYIWHHDSTIIYTFLQHMYLRMHMTEHLHVFSVSKSASEAR